MVRSQFLDNKASLSGDGSGGVMYAPSGAKVHATDCTFERNIQTAPFSTMGAGVFFNEATEVIFERYAIF